MKVLICIPCMDTMETAFIECLTALLNRPRDYEIEVKLAKGSMVYLARNQLMEYAISKNDADFLLWLDSDMTFEPDFLDRMLESIGDRDQMAALCFTRVPPLKAVVYKGMHIQQLKDGVKPIAEEWTDYPRDTLFEVAGIGFAGMLQRMATVKKVKEVFPLPFFPYSGFGEDLTYCFHAAQCGLKTWCNSSIKMGHLMRLPVDEEFVDFMRAATGQTQPQQSQD